MVERYEDHLHIAEYERPHDRSAAEHADWMDLMVRTAADVLDARRKNVYVKRRERQRGFQQYEKAAEQRHRLLVREGGFQIYCGTRETGTHFDDAQCPSAETLKSALLEYADPDWVVFQLYYPMTPQEVQSSSGSDLVESILAIMKEVAPLMNECMQIRLPQADST